MRSVLFASFMLGTFVFVPVPLPPRQAFTTFAVTLSTGPAWIPGRAPNDQPHMRLHSMNLRRLRDEGVVLAGGRYGPYGLILIEAADSAAVARMFLPDSAVQTGVFAIRIDRWRTFYNGCVE